MIEWRGVTARYAGGAREVVSGVSLRAHPGAVTAIVGPNGSGKSTLVRALLGRVARIAGEVVLDGRPVESWPGEERARRLAVVGQREEPVFPLRVEDYVALGRHPLRGAWAAITPEDRAAVHAALHAVDATPLTERGTDELSGGEWQRVRLARALAQGSDNLVVDEPTTFMDIAHEMACFEVLSAQAAAGRTVLVVSHQLNLVARFAHHVVLLAAGKVVAAGSANDVMRGDVLEAVYEWPLVVTRDPAVGAPSLVPLRRPRA